MHARFAQQLANALDHEFSGKIYLDDVKQNGPDRTDQFHTRALSAMVVRFLTNCSASRAADYVTDGADDQDIDAVAYDERLNKIWFIQSKWSAGGKGKIREKDIKTFTLGVGYSLNGEHQRFNKRYWPHEAAIESILNNDPQVGFVIAIASPKDLHPDHRKILQEYADKVGKYYSKPAEIEVLTLDRLAAIAKAGMGEPPINLQVQFSEAQADNVPHRVYFGTVSADEIARWFSAHGERLFRRNIRGALGRTTVNEAIRNTLIERPEHFLDFNNGITLVARSGALGMNKSGLLKDVAIVNGAQTVSSIAETVKEYPAAGNAKVLVKASIAGEQGDDLIREITYAANTQNRVEIRDLASLYEQQEELQQEFQTVLGLKYTTRHTEAAPAGKEGCTNEEALIALACGHADFRYAVQANIHPDALWDRKSGGPYRNLFRSGISAIEVWRNVKLLRVVRSTLETERKKLQGKARQVAEHGELFATHLVARQFADLIHVDDWDDVVLSKVSATTRSTLKRLVSSVADQFPRTHPSSLFKDEDKSYQLQFAVLSAITDDMPVPDFEDDHVKGRNSRKNKSPKLVPLLTKHRVIEDGTALEFRPLSREHRQLFHRWNTEDPRRSRATWVNDSKNQLRWEVDGKTYSASRLALKLIHELSEKQYKSVRGTECWYIPGRGSLKDIGLRLQDEIKGEASDTPDEGLF